MKEKTSLLINLVALLQNEYFNPLHKFHCSNEENVLTIYMEVCRLGIGSKVLNANL